MKVPVWVVWLFAIAIAISPLSTLLMSRMDLADGSSIEVCNTPEVSSEDIQDIEDVDEAMILYIAKIITEHQLSQYWGKDLSRIE